MTEVEKIAQSSGDERMKYLKAAILAGVAAAGIGAWARESKYKKDREKALDISQSKNAIVVPVKKEKFMEGLPTPKELAESRGELPQMPSQETPALENQVASSPQQAVSDLDDADIEARKKAILGARRFNFFGKHAAENEKDDETKEDKKDGGKGSERVFLRDQTGKFVSPTDPVGVEQEKSEPSGDGEEKSEKKGEDHGVSDLFFHPIDSLERAFNAAKDRPVLFTAGAVGSIYLAAKISDMINESRKKRAKELLDSARSEYVKELETPEEKRAQWDVRDVGGVLFGSALLVPMALTAIVTNKIIENRRAEKNRMKETSDSYPDDPYILYKTSSGEEVEISPESVLVDIMTKAAMIRQVEIDEKRLALEKSAGIVFPSPYKMDTTVNYVTDLLGKPENEGSLIELTRAFGTKDFDDVYKKEVDKIKGTAGAGGILHLGNVADPNFRISLLRNQRFQKLVTDRVANSPLNSAWGKFRMGRVNQILGQYFQPGSIIYNILSWLTNNTGLGGYFARRMANDTFAKINGTDKAPAPAPTQQKAAASSSDEEVNSIESIRDAIYDLNYYRGLGIDKTKDNPWGAISGFPSDISYSATNIGDLDDSVKQEKVDDSVKKFMRLAKGKDRKTALDIVKKLSGKFARHEKAFRNRHREEANDMVKNLRGRGNRASGELADWMESWHRK